MGPAKVEVNFRKHRVRFEEAKPVFDDPYSLTVADNGSSSDEQRFVTIGAGALGRILIAPPHMEARISALYTPV